LARKTSQSRWPTVRSTTFLGVMAMAAVHGLEAVEVRAADREALAGAPGLRETAPQKAFEELAVGQARQRVVQGLVPGTAARCA
jgi:hypothetical protein